MSEYFSKIRKDIFKKVTLFFLVMQGSIIVIVTVLHLVLASARSWLPGFIFFILEMVAFIVLLFFLKKYLKQTLGSQEAVSRIIFQNTRNVLNNISHEWRTPLNAIMGFTEQLYISESDTSRKEALKAIGQNSDRLFAISEKLFDYSAIEMGLYKIEPQYHSIELLLANIQNKYDGKAEEKNLKLETKCETTRGKFFFFDFKAVFEILSMLVENSIKFSSNGAGTIIIKAVYRSRSLIFSVADQGTGIDNSKKKVVFKLYRQGTYNLDREYEGIGLGLTIAARLTELLKGSIRIKDNSPQGTIVMFKIKSLSSQQISSDKKDGQILFVDPLGDSQKEILSQSIIELKGCLKVFNPGNIEVVARSLLERDPLFKNVSEKLKAIAGSYDEVELQSVVQQLEEVLKG